MKLEQIVKAGRDDKQNYFVIGSSSNESTSSEKNRSSNRRQSSDQNSSAMRTDESEYYEAFHIAKVWAGKLRKLTRCQKLYAEKAIQDILFEAQLGNLHKSSVKINGKICCTKQTPSATSNTHTSYTSISTNNGEPLYGSLLEPDYNDQVDIASSEVLLISESYPNDNAIPSSESHADDLTSTQKLSKVLEHTRNQTFIIAASRNALNQVPPNSQSSECIPLDIKNQDAFDENSFVNAATNTPDCIFKQLSRYIRDCYDNCKHYLPPTQL